MLKIWMVGGVFSLYFHVYSKVVEYSFVLKLVFALSAYGFSKRKRITFVLKRNLGWLCAGVGGDLFYSMEGSTFEILKHFNALRIPQNNHINRKEDKFCLVSGV